MKEILAKLAAIDCSITESQLSAYLETAKLNPADITSDQAIAALAEGLKAASTLATTPKGGKVSSKRSSRKSRTPDPRASAIAQSAQEADAFKQGIGTARDRFVESEAEDNAALIQETPVAIAQRTVEILQTADYDPAFFRAGGEAVFAAAFGLE